MPCPKSCPVRQWLAEGQRCLEARARWAVCFWWAELFHRQEEIPLFLHVHMCLGSAPQEITKLMQQPSTMQDNLYQMQIDLLSDLKVKRRALESPLLRTERNLYVYYY